MTGVDGISMDPIDEQQVVQPAEQGISGDLESWLHLNLVEAFQSEEAAGRVSAFPPEELMHNTSGLTSEKDFASHGVDFIRALAAVSPRPLHEYEAILDFGMGVGRIARLFKGFEGRYVGVDIDPRHLEWVASNLPHVEAVQSKTQRPIPLGRDTFDAVISISVFSHLNESDHRFYLSELARVTRPGAFLFLSIHGDRALHRAATEPKIFEMLAIPEERVVAAQECFANGKGYDFVRQEGHLTDDDYEYGITFISERYIQSVWSDWFDVVALAKGALHDFQDIVVLRSR